MKANIQSTTSVKAIEIDLSFGRTALQKLFHFQVFLYKIMIKKNRKASNSHELRPLNVGVDINPNTINITQKVKITCKLFIFHKLRKEGFTLRVSFQIFIFLIYQQLGSRQKLMMNLKNERNYSVLYIFQKNSLYRHVSVVAHNISILLVFDQQDCRTSTPFFPFP